LLLPFFIYIYAMAQLNPNLPLRTAYIQGLPGYVTVPVWAKKVPKNVQVPSQYILITSQTKQPTAEGKDCFEWLCTVVVDCIFAGVAGFAAPINGDLMEEKVCQFVFDGVEMSGWQVKSNDFIQSVDLDVETPTQSIERRVITFQHWINQNGYPTT
jgi:hypothetical protein